MAAPADYRRVKSFLPLVVGLIATAASFAHAAASNIGATRVGSGSIAISGYDVSELSYELTGNRIVSVSFSLDPPVARTVRVRLSPVDLWHDCLLSNGLAVCAVPHIDAEALQRLGVVASS